MIVSGSDDGTVRVWDAATGTPVGAPLTGHTGPVWSVAVGRVDGRDSHRLRQRRRDGAGVGRGHRHPDRRTVDRPHRPGVGGGGGAASTAATVIVSGSDDGTVRVWDAATGTPIGAPLTGHTGWVRSVAVGRRRRAAT